MNLFPTNISDKARANRLARILQTAIISILTVSYIFEGAKNNIGPIGLAVIFASLWIPVIAGFLVYKRDPESPLIKHIIGIGYGIFYILICIISEQ